MTGGPAPKSYFSLLCSGIATCTATGASAAAVPAAANMLELTVRTAVRPLLGSDAGNGKTSGKSGPPKCRRVWGYVAGRKKDLGRRWLLGPRQA